MKNPTTDLSSSERLLHELLDNTEAVVYVKDHEFRYQFVNRRWTELFGLSLEETKGRTDFELFSADLAAVFREHDDFVLSEGKPLQVEEQAPHDDGLHTYVSLKFPISDSRLAGISTDITESVEAQRALQSVTRRLESILNSSTDGIFGIDADGRVTFANDAAERLLGRTSEELAGLAHDEVACFEPIGGGDPSAVREPIAAAIEQGSSRHVPGALLVRPDKTRIPVEYTASPLVDGGSVEGAVVTMHDLSDARLRRQQDEELKTARILQEQLYPERPPVLAGIDLGGAVYPATHACGDYFDFIPFRDGQVLAVGDVTGHGLAAALQMVETRALLRVLVEMEDDLERVLRRLNTELVSDTPSGSFISLFLAYVDPVERVLTYMGAGHDARLIRRDGSIERLPSTGMLLGLMSDAPIGEPRQTPLEPGDVLVLLTDGVFEAMSEENELFGLDRALRCVQSHRHLPAETIIQRLQESATEFIGPNTFKDDLTIVIARVLDE